MYPVSSVFKEKIQELNRVFEMEIRIEHSNGTLLLNDSDIVQGTFVINDGTQSGEDFTIGGIVASDLSFSILRKPEYDNINFYGAKVYPTIKLLVDKGVDTENYFLPTTQVNDVTFESGIDEWEPVPLGVFNIDDVIKGRNEIGLKAIDNMITLDIPYSESNLVYPATLYQIYTNICSIGDIAVGTMDFPNKDYLVKDRPIGDYTLRDILSCVAQLAGSFAKMNRYGQMEVKWHTPVNITIRPNNRFDLKISDDVVKIKGIVYTVAGEGDIEDTTYLAGSLDYAIDISENPLLQNNYETVLPIIFNNVKDTICIPYSSEWQGNPALEAGDSVTQIDVDGNVHNTVVTHCTFKYRGKSVLSGKGIPELRKGFKGSTDKRIGNIIKAELKPIANQLSSLQQAQLDATELIANMLGGYTHFEADAFYISDNPVLAESTKIWKWGIGGFGYSDDGGETYKTGITANGSIVANLISAGIVTADMVQTGILQSQDGTTWINLDNGEFNFKNAIKWIDGQLVIEGMDEVDLTEIENQIDELTTQLDGKIETWYQSTDPSSTWTSAEKIKHTGDMWYNTSSNKLQRYNSSSWVAMEDQTAIDALNLVNNKSVIFTSTPTPPYKVGDLWKVSEIAGVDFKICTTTRLTGSYLSSHWVNVTDSKNYADLIKNLTTGTSISGGITTIDRTKVRVEHGSGQYSEMKADGFIRKWLYGEANYLNDIYIRKFYEKGDIFNSEPNPYRIYLPLSFRDRTNVEIYIVPLAFEFSGGNTYRDGSVREITRWNDMICRVKVLSRLTGQESKDLNANPPWVDIEAYIESYYKTTNDNVSEYLYEGLDWMLMVVGY